MHEVGEGDFRAYLGCETYRAWMRSQGHMDAAGEALPEWLDLEDREQEAWRFAAEYVMERAKWIFGPRRLVPSEKKNGS